MPPLIGQQLYAYNHLPCIPYAKPLGDLLNTVIGNGAIGNSALLFRLTTLASVVKLYCSPDGNDITGDGSQGTPYRTPQRACDEIPSSQAAGTPVGWVQVVLLTGNYPYDCVLGEKRAPLLTVVITGDTTVQSGEYTLPLGVRPKLTNDPTKDKAASWNYNVGPLGYALSSGSHWADQPFVFDAENTISIGIAAVDGVNSSGSNLRLVEAFDPSLNGTPVHVRPVVSSIDVRGATGFVKIANENLGGTRLFVSGVLIAADYSISVVNTNVYGAVVAGVTDQTNVGFNHNTLVNNAAVFQDTISQLSFQDGNQTSIGGIFECNVVVDGPSSEFVIGGVLRGRDGDNVAMYIGGPTGGRIGSSTDVEPEGLDIEGLGFIQVQGAATRWGNHAPVTIDGNTCWFVARYGAKMKFQTVYGVTTTIPCIFEAGTHVYSGTAGLSGQLSNSGTPGDEFKIRADETDPGTIYAFSDATVVDAPTLTRVAA